MTTNLFCFSRRLPLRTDTGVRVLPSVGTVRKNTGLGEMTLDDLMRVADVDTNSDNFSLTIGTSGKLWLDGSRIGDVVDKIGGRLSMSGGRVVEINDDGFGVRLLRFFEVVVVVVGVKLTSGHSSFTGCVKRRHIREENNTYFALTSSETKYSHFRMSLKTNFSHQHLLAQKK